METLLQPVPKATKNTTIICPLRKAMKHRDINLNEDDRCNYVHQNGGVCDKKFPAPKDGARHWFTNHVMEEVKSIERGTLDMKRARILNTAAKLKTASKYKIYCPLTGCSRTRRNNFFVRQESIVRHLMQCGLRRNVTVSSTNAKMWAHANMELWRNSLERGSCWETAVWKIHHGM